MSITLLYGCFHVELSVRDLDAARAFMEGVLGAGRIEQQLAREVADLVPDGGYRVDHLSCGQATFQLNEPSASLVERKKRSAHRGYLDRVGPCVSNLNYYVDDVVHACELLSDMGADTLLEGPSSAAKSLADYGPCNTRPGSDKRPFLFMGSRHLIGLDLEIMEPNFLHFAEQAVQFPCFVRPHRGTDDRDLQLQRLRIAVDDLAATYHNVVRLFTPGSRSQPYADRRGTLARAFRISLGGIELEYCEPLAGKGPLAGYLERYGPGVVTVEFGARDVGAILERVRAASTPEVAEEADLIGEQHRPRRWQIASREIVGFDVVLEGFGGTHSLDADPVMANLGSECPTHQVREWPASVLRAGAGSHPLTDGDVFLQ
jgi:catechol 2,3-dioxygenase-like lactoylglutathione lyase family enzyme